MEKGDFMTVRLLLNTGDYALIDKKDYKKVRDYSWYKMSIGYVSAYIGKIDGRYKVSYLHRFIMEPRKSQVVDHINGDKLDNRRANLRLCVGRNNSWNRAGVKLRTSVYKGVYWSKRSKGWIAQIGNNYKIIYLGTFEKEHHAALVYDLWAVDLYGEYAKLNFKRIGK